MIKAIGQGASGQRLLILGLSRKNTELLLAGRPISVDLRSLMGLEATVLLIAGETEEDLVRQLREAAGTTVEVEVNGPEPRERG